jgi:hypothetical protein
MHHNFEQQFDLTGAFGRQTKTQINNTASSLSSIILLTILEPLQSKTSTITHLRLADVRKVLSQQRAEHESNLVARQLVVVGDGNLLLLLLLLLLFDLRCR